MRRDDPHKSPCTETSTINLQQIVATSDDPRLYDVGILLCTFLVLGYEQIRR